MHDCMAAGTRALACLIGQHGPGLACTSPVSAPVPAAPHPLCGQGQHGRGFACRTDIGEPVVYSISVLSYSCSTSPLQHSNLCKVLLLCDQKCSEQMQRRSPHQALMRAFLLSLRTSTHFPVAPCKGCLATPALLPLGPHMLSGIVSQP